jgi:alpha-methylacyl-CoA racemase
MPRIGVPPATARKPPCARPGRCHIDIIERQMGPLAGLRVLEFEAIGPGPFAAMMLADMGADVLLVDRASDSKLGLDRERRHDVMLRGRRSVTLDLKSVGGAEAALRLAEQADVIVEGFRPGVMERLGLGPEVMLARNPRLVYGRMTGWGQEGPLAARAGHDIDYIALSGVLHAIGRTGEAPVPPLNLIGDFGGGGMLLAFGIACGVIEARGSGQGQVVDAAMIDGASLLATMFSGLLAAGQWTETRGENALDSGAPWYDTYATGDGKHVAIGAIEAKFYAELLARLGLDAAELPAQHDRTGWPLLRRRFAERFAARTRDEWCAAFEGSDACFAPVLSFSESRRDAHRLARKGTIELGGIAQPAPAPRFGRTPGAALRPPPERGAGGRSALQDWGFSPAAIDALLGLGLGASS